MRLLLLLPLLFSAVQASPIQAPSRRRIDPDQLDVLVRGPNNTLVRATREEARAALAPLGRQLTKRQEPGETGNLGSGSCPTTSNFELINNQDPYCSIFCDAMSQIVTGVVQTASQDMDCTTPTCSVAKAETVSITQTWSYNTGLKIPKTFDFLNFLNDVSFGFTYSVAQQTSTADTFTFTPTVGTVGHIDFIPYMVETCGSTTLFSSFENSGDGAGYSCNDGSDGSAPDVISYDPIVCTQQPITNPDDNNNAAGVFTFCHTDTQYGCT